LRLVLGFLIIAVLLVLPLLAPQLENHQPLIDYRQERNLSLAASESGITRYQSWGNRKDPVVVLIHSFNGYLETWEPNIEALVNAGYRVVAYDLFGRGLSDRPLKPHTLALFREQLTALRDTLGITTPMHLIGASFGCVIASDFALHHPDQVKSLTLTGPAGWPDDKNAAQEWARKPFLGEYIFYYAGKPLLLSKLDSYLLNQEDNPWAKAYWKVYQSYPGVKRAALSTLRYSPVLDYTAGWQKLGKTKLPVQFIWGRQDSSFPYYHHREAEKLIPQAKIVAIDSAEHWVNADQPTETNRAIIDFLRGIR